RRNDQNRLRSGPRTPIAGFPRVARADDNGGVDDLDPPRERRRKAVKQAPSVTGEFEGHDRLPVERTRKDDGHARRAGESAAHAAERPPSTPTPAPVPHPASSEARYATAPATSSTSPSRPSG